MRKTTKMVAVLAAMSVMVLGAATMVSAAEKQGWVKEGSDWYYYNGKEEKLVNAWAQDGSGLWYFLGDEGKMLKNAFVDNEKLAEVEDTDITDAKRGEYYYVNGDGVMVANAWNKAKIGDAANKDTPYAGSESTAWYCFDANGKMYGDAWVLSGSKWYHVNKTGKMDEYTLVDGKYYVTKDGVMVTGWHQATNKDEEKSGLGLVEKDWIWANADGELVKSEWKKIDSKWYFFGGVTGTTIDGDSTKSVKNYVMLKDAMITDKSGKSFVVARSGAMATGWVEFGEDVYYYAHTTKGELTKNKVERISNKYYYFDVNGVSVDEGYAVKTENVVNTKTVTAYQTVLDKDATIEDAVTEAKANVTGATLVYKLGSLITKEVK